MPSRLSDATYGEKLITLFGELFFSGRANYTLTELTKMLGCSKQQAARIMDTVGKKLPLSDSKGERNQKVYSIERAKIERPYSHISLDDLTVLEMCRAFAENLLGQDVFAKSVKTLRSVRALMPKDENRNPPAEGLGCFTPGAIDYSRHQDTIFRLTDALRENRVCRLWYLKAGAEKESTFDVMPLKLFAFRDTIYLHARLYLEGEKPRPGTFDPLLAVHRIRKANIRNKLFTPPADYDFDRVFNQSFGIVKGKTFRMRVAFSGWAATYARERVWSPDQAVEEQPDGTVEIAFTASSEWEASSRVLSFRGQAKVLEPQWLVEQVRREAAELCRLHG